MASVKFRGLELFLLFVLVPVSMALPIPVVAKLGIGFAGFFYVVFVLLRIERVSLKLSKGIRWKKFWRFTLVQLLVIILFTIAYVLWVDASKLFVVVKTKPLLWLVILFVYSLFSVYPQELIYRTFFFKRYAHLFTNQTLFIVINAALFSLAHIFFRNSLVMVLTFLGGILFALTFKRTQSTLLVSIEHAIYGCWLFTVGMGDMLGFPS